MLRSALFIFGVSFPVAAIASGPNIELAIVNNQIVTTHCFNAANASYALAGATYVGENYDPLYANQTQRVFDVPLVQNASDGTTFGIPDAGWYGQILSDGSAAFTGPGIAYGANADLIGNPTESGFDAGSLIAEYLVGSLKVWNGSAFTPSTTDRLEGIQGSLDDDNSAACFTDPSAVETGSWGVIPSAIGPDDNSQVEWRLDYINSEVPDVSPADGIYLAELQVGTNQRINGASVSPSLPFYFVFDKNDAGQAAAADAYVQNVLTPEPGMMGVIICSLPILSRRRRACV